MLSRRTFFASLFAAPAALTSQPDARRVCPICQGTEFKRYGPIVTGAFTDLTRDSAHTIVSRAEYFERCETCHYTLIQDGLDTRA